MEYIVGDLVWAKVKGHPYWPARVNRVPSQRGRKQGKYDVFFYGTHEHAYVLQSNLKPYSANSLKYRKPSKRTGFAEGIWEIEEDPDLVITLGRKRALWPLSSQNTSSNKRIKEEINSDSGSNEHMGPNDSSPGACMLTDITNTSNCQAGMKGGTPFSNEIKEDTPLSNEIKDPPFSNDELENSSPLLEQSTSCGSPPSPIVSTPPYHRALFWKNVHQQNTINSGVKKGISPSGIEQPPPEDHVLTTSTPPVLTTSTPPVLTTSTPPVLTTSTPPVLTTSTPPVLTTSTPPVLTTSTPPVLTTSTPPVLTTSTPPVLTTSTPPVLTTSKLWAMTQEENQVVPCEEFDYKEMSLYEKFSEESLMHHPTTDKKSLCLKEPSCLPNMECESSDQPTQSSPTKQVNQLNKSSPIEGDDQPTQSSPTEQDDQPPKSSPTKSDDQPTKSSPTQQDDQLNESSPTEGDDQATKSSPTQQDDQPTQSSPTEGDDQLNESSPTEGDDQLNKSSPTEGDDQLNKSSPTEGDDQLIKSSPTEGDDQPPKSSPTEGDDQPPKSSPTEGDDQPTKSSPTQQDDQLNQSSPSKQSNFCHKSNGSSKLINGDDLELKDIKVVRVRQALKEVELVKTTTYNLKCALRRMDPNMKQALRYLGDIHDAQLDFDTLKEFPDIVRTIRKLRRYKANERISKKANQIFFKFKGMYIKSVKGKSSKQPVEEPSLANTSATPGSLPQTDTAPTSKSMC